MVGNSNDTRRIAKNTLFLYARSLFSLFVSLYSSRLILQALGVDDYGVYNVVGGFVSMFWLVSGSLSSAVTRFLNFAMGKGDEEQLRKVFSMSLNILLVLAIVVLILTESFGIWFFNHKMNIPAGREDAAFWVFQFSVITVMSGFSVVPFNAAIVAHEKMGVYAYLGIAEALIRLIIALVLVYGTSHADKLVLYALLWLIATLMMQGAAAFYCVRLFPECRFKIVFDPRLFKEMIGFSGWKFLGSISHTFSGQGVNVALNMAYGTAINAARGLTGTVSNAVGIFYNNFILALNPQITKSFAAGDMDYVKSLSFRGTKFCFYIMFLFALPLFLEIKFVLGIWLVEVPNHTANFIRLSLIITLIDLHSAVFNMVLFASGKIIIFQLLTSIMIFLNFPASYLALHWGAVPEITYVINIFVVTVNVFISLWLVHSIIGFSIREIIGKVFSRMTLTAIISIIPPLVIHLLFPFGWKRFLLTLATSLACTIPAVLYIGCSRQERTTLLYDYILPRLNKSTKRTS